MFALRRGAALYREQTPHSTAGLRQAVAWSGHDEAAGGEAMQVVFNQMAFKSKLSKLPNPVKVRIMRSALMTFANGDNWQGDELTGDDALDMAQSSNTTCIVQFVTAWYDKVTWRQKPNAAASDDEAENKSIKCRGCGPIPDDRKLTVEDVIELDEAVPDTFGDTTLSHVTAMFAQMAEVVSRTAQTSQSYGKQLAQMEARYEKMQRHQKRELAMRRLAQARDRSKFCSEGCCFKTFGRRARKLSTFVKNASLRAMYALSARCARVVKRCFFIAFVSTR